MPGGVAARCETSTWVPRLPSPASRCGASNCAQVHSISTIMKPVANTFGICRDDRRFQDRCKAPSCSPAPCRRSECLRPGLRVGFMTTFFSGSPVGLLAAPSGLLVARQHVVGAFPRRQEIEGAEFLRQRHLVVDHALLLVVVAHLDEAGERKILAQRMPLETVIGEDAPHVGMAGEQHAVEIVGLALEPVGAAKHVDQRRHRRRLVGRHLDAHALVQPRRQEMIDDVEALLARRPIDRGDVDDVDELAGRIVAQECRDLDDVGGLGVTVSSPRATA